jgi:TolA-binding protein
MEQVDIISVPKLNNTTYHFEKLYVHKLDVWSCSCLCCNRMRPMYHDVAHKQVISVMDSYEKQKTVLRDEIEILRYENWQFQEDIIKKQERIDELESLLYKGYESL